MARVRIHQVLQYANEIASTIIHDTTGIVLEAYSPLGNPGRPEVGATDPVVLEDAVVKEIATKHGATVAQVCRMLCISIVIYLVFVHSSAYPLPSIVAWW